ncbi:MAG: nicotinate phosphoribosyltransferase [Anaerolineae bacterium]|nr:nicotinate phosphoribosyltransferase [Anaerolineae bacterium]
MKIADQEMAEGILFTDMYQLTMAHVYFQMGLHEKQVQFDHFFRDYPDYGTHKAGYCINAGLEWLLDWMARVHFRDEDIEYLRGQKTHRGDPMFRPDFLDWLQSRCDFSSLSLWAIPEGRVVHPNEPLTVVRGPIALAQILETSLLNHLNYQTLIATKASRIHEVGRKRLLLEFGLRRAQGKGANAGARAALIGGADYSSNVGASAVMGTAPKGTHAHSLVQLYMALGMGELEAFQAYADVFPDETILLVDTIDTIESGVPNAIKVFEGLRRKGYAPLGIRLDSGDLAYLSIQAARMLNEAGFEDVSIVLSNNLDELVIWQIITQISLEAPRYGLDADRLINRLVYGVGTHLITSWGEPALGGVYKLVAVYDQDKWIPALKVSESPTKTPNPGYKRVWRVYDNRGNATADLISLDEEDFSAEDQVVLRHPYEYSKMRTLNRSEISEIEPLLVEVLREGQLVYDLPDLEQIRLTRNLDIERLDPGVKRIMNPHIYHVSLSNKLLSLKQTLIDEAREKK